MFFFKQKTAYEMRISDWSSDVCSSDLWSIATSSRIWRVAKTQCAMVVTVAVLMSNLISDCGFAVPAVSVRSEEHTSELQSLMRISYDVLSLKQTKTSALHSSRRHTQSTIYT